MNSTQDLIEFNQLFAQHQQRFIRFANSYLQNNELAEDFTADAFMHYWETRGTLKPDTNPPAYILTILKNKCINHLQHQKVRLRVEKQLSDHTQWVLTTRIETLEACEPDELFSKEIQKIVSDTLEALPEKTRRIFTMSRQENFTQKEIAQIIGISSKGVEFHIAKALKIMRCALKDYLTAFLFLFWL